MLPELATYFTWSDFNKRSPSTVDEFHADLRKFARNKVVYLCSVLNSFLNTWEGPKLFTDTHAELVRYGFRPALANTLIEGSRNPAHRRFVFHRQQLLFVSKEAVLHCTEDGIDPLTSPFWGEFGIVLLKANDHLHFGPTRKSNSEAEALEMLPEFVLLHEYSGHSGFGYRVVRSHLMHTRFAQSLRSDPHYVDIPRKFAEVSGLMLPEYEALCFAVLTRYMNAGLPAFKENPGSFLVADSYFRSTAIHQEKIVRFLQEMSGTGEDFRANFENRNLGPCDFTWFRDKPIFHDGDNLYAIDSAFLAEKLETGPFWRVLASLPSNALKERLHAFWGSVFQEYLHWLFSTSVGADTNRYYPGPKYVSDGNEACDAIILHGSTAVLLEYKGSTFTAHGKYGGDANLLADEIRAKLVSSQGEKKGVTQLASTIYRLFNRRDAEKLQSIDLCSVRTIYPVMVTRDDIGGALLMNYHLNEEFQQIVDKKALRPHVVTPLFILTADEVEFISAYLNDVRFSDILEARYRSDKSLKTPFHFSDNSALAEKGIRRNAALQREFEGLSNCITQELFPGAPPLPPLPHS